jgi:ribosomal protein S19E (S16A)
VKPLPIATKSQRKILQMIDDGYLPIAVSSNRYVICDQTVLRRTMKRLIAAGFVTQRDGGFALTEVGRNLIRAWDEEDDE